MHRDPFQIVRQVPGFASILARKPLLAAAVLRSQAIEWRRGRAGKKSLSSIDFAVTYACQASCEHCSATSLHDKVREKNRLSFSEMAVLGRKLADMGYARWQKEGATRLYSLTPEGTSDLEEMA